MVTQFDDGKDDGAMRTIGEVSRALGIKTHVLRYWEQQLPMLEPLKRSSGRRYYRAEDVKLIGRINRLVNNEGYTLRGAQQVIESGKTGIDPKIDHGTKTGESPISEEAAAAVAGAGSDSGASDSDDSDSENSILLLADYEESSEAPDESSASSIAFDVNEILAGAEQSAIGQGSGDQNFGTAAALNANDKMPLPVILAQIKNIRSQLADAL